MKVGDMVRCVDGRLAVIVDEGGYRQQLLIMYRAHRHEYYGEWYRLFWSHKNILKRYWEVVEID